MSKKADEFKQSILFLVLKIGFNTSSFTPTELRNDLKNLQKRETLEDIEERFLERNFSIADVKLAVKMGLDKGIVTDESMFLNLRFHRNNEEVYCLTTEAKFKYIDFLELEQARENSQQARKYAKISIGIAIGALVISALGTIIEFVSLNLTS